MTNILITLGVFVFLIWFNYVGAKGRIEGKNQFSGKKQELGARSPEDHLSLINGTYKMRAFKQALFGSIILSGILYLILWWVN